MIGYLLPGLDPFEHLAIEEVLLTGSAPACGTGAGDSMFLMYRNRPSVIVGSHQDTALETDVRYLRDRGIALARRISGGGCVYHDEGNLCWSFLLPCDHPEVLRLGEHLDVLVQALNAMGLPVEQSERHDMTLLGHKISGSAARIMRGRLLLHGTLLYDSDLEELHEALTPEKKALESKATMSVHAKVANIRDLLGKEPLVLDEEASVWRSSIDAFAAGIFGALDLEPFAFEMNEAFKAEVERLLEDKYLTEHWIFGKNPKGTYQE